MPYPAYKSDNDLVGLISVAHQATAIPAFNSASVFAPSIALAHSKLARAQACANLTLSVSDQRS